MIHWIKRVIRVVINPIWHWANRWEVPDLRESFTNLQVPLGNIIQVATSWKSPDGMEFVEPDGRWLNKDDYLALWELFDNTGKDFGYQEERFNIPDFRDIITVTPGIKTVMRIK